MQAVRSPSATMFLAAFEEAGRGLARRRPAEEPAVAKEFGGPKYGVEAIWRKPGRWAAGSECRGCLSSAQSTTGRHGSGSARIPRHEHVPIMDGAAGVTLSRSHGQRQPGLNRATARAGLAAPEVTIDTNELPLVPLTLVGQLTAELTERRILDRTGQKAAHRPLALKSSEGSRRVAAQAARTMSFRPAREAGLAGLRR